MYYYLKIRPVCPPLNPSFITRDRNSHSSARNLSGLGTAHPCVATVYRLLNRRRCHDNEVWDERMDQMDRPPPPVDFKTNTARTSRRATCLKPTHRSALNTYTALRLGAAAQTRYSLFYDHHWSRRSFTAHVNVLLHAQGLSKKTLQF
jgi:hypothetical protein